MTYEVVTVVRAGAFAVELMAVAEVDPESMKDELLAVAVIDRKAATEVKGMSAREMVETFIYLAPLDETKVANVEPIAVPREGSGRPPRTGTVAFVDEFKAGPQIGRHA